MTERTKADEMVDQFRSDYPDLTEAEERAIRDHVETGTTLFFRCTASISSEPGRGTSQPLPHGIIIGADLSKL